MTEGQPAGPLVLHPDDRVARLGGRVIAGVAGLGIVAAIVEFAGAHSPGGGAVALVVAAVAGVLAVVVLYGSAHLEVRVDAAAVTIGARTIGRSEIVGLMRRGERARALDLVDAEGEVLYSMPAWFSAEQEQAFAVALGVPIEERPAEEDAEADGEDAEAAGEDAGAAGQDAEADGEHAAADGEHAAADGEHAGGAEHAGPVQSGDGGAETATPH